MKTVNDYFSLAKEIHDDNVKAGWWSKPRSTARLISPT